MNSMGHDENNQAFKAYMAKIEEVKIMKERSFMFFEQSERLREKAMRLEEHARIADKERIIHPLYKIERFTEATKAWKDATARIKLAEWTLDQAEEMALQAYKEYNSSER